jgi:hypothetical protein
VRKKSIFVCIVLGSSIGLFATIPEGIGLKIVMMSIGAIAGAAIGGAIARFRNSKGASPLKRETDAFIGLGVEPEDLMHNYWRDKGRLPLTDPLEPERGDHMFDPDH